MLQPGPAWLSSGEKKRLQVLRRGPVLTWLSPRTFSHVGPRLASVPAEGKLRHEASATLGKSVPGSGNSREL